jgi:hypothetical protein
MALVAEGAPTRLVKSSIRVRDLGEVFTPNATVQAMLDLLPASVWTPHPAHSFLEPACGDGNFLVAILDRKLERITSDYVSGTLLGGQTTTAARFHALEALSSIYAVDISVENVVGGSPGHELGARERLLNLVADWDAGSVPLDEFERSQLLRAAGWVVNHNILIGNMLPITASGLPTGRDALPLIDYEWDPGTLKVAVQKTTMGDVIGAAETDSAGTTALFSSPAPTFLWKGDALRLWEVARVEAPVLVGPARNGVRLRDE